MGKYDEGNVEGVARRTMVLYFLVDTSGSMMGSKIGEVNDAIEGIIPELQDITVGNADAIIKIAILTFSSGASWMYPAPIEAENFKWNYVNADGVTDMGVAFSMLNDKLSRSGFMSDLPGSYAPAIFLMSDGTPTDDYVKGLEKLKANNWFKYALKAAVAIGDSADTNMLAEFTGNPESVLMVHTPEALKKVIRFVSVTASKIGSQSTSVGECDSELQSKQDDFNKQIIDFDDSLLDADQDNW